jgi:hypothetical protein
MSSFEKMDLYMDFAGRCIYLSEAQKPYTPSHYTLYTCVYTLQYTYSHMEGGRGESWTRWLEGQQFTKLGRKYQQDWLYLQSLNSDKHLTQSPFTGQLFIWRHFALVFL